MPFPPLGDPPNPGNLTVALTNTATNTVENFSLVKSPLSLASPTTPSLTLKVVQDLFFLKNLLLYFIFRSVYIYLYFPSSSPEYSTVGILLTYYSNGLEIIKETIITIANTESFLCSGFMPN